MSSMNRKLIISVFILLFSNLCTFFLSKHALMLAIVFIVIAYIKHRTYPIKKELLWFTSIFVGGPMVEIILVNFSKAWSYSDPQLFGIPIWIPFYWGLMGTTLIVSYEGLTNK